MVGRCRGLQLGFYQTSFGKERIQWIDKCWSAWHTEWQEHTVPIPEVWLGLEPSELILGRDEFFLPDYS